jgi:hypothetical protein
MASQAFTVATLAPIVEKTGVANPGDTIIVDHVTGVALDSKFGPGGGGPGGGVSLPQPTRDGQMLVADAAKKWTAGDPDCGRF